MIEPAKTVSEQVEAWDRGESVWSIALGGLGPGYEQAIQIAAIEFARAATGMDRTFDEERDMAELTRRCDEALKRFDDQIGGITGAMYGAAKWLAWQWCFEGGPAALVERARESGKGERVIQVSKRFPRAPSSPDADKFPEWPEGVP